jgi:hypothetical protein
MLLKLEQVVISSTLILEKLPEEMGSKLYSDRVIQPLIFSKWCDDPKSNSFDVVINILNVKINALQTFNLIISSEVAFE